MRKDNMPVFVRTAIASSLLAAFLPAQGADEITMLTKPESEITLTAGHVSEDNARFGQYNGMRNKGAKGVVDLQINQRDEESGAWFSINGRNLGRDDTEFRLDQSKAGDWGYFVEFTKTPRFEPLNFTSRNGGIGSQTIVLPTAGTQVPVTLGTERDKITFGASKRLAESFDLSVRVQSEEKEGTRLFEQTSHQFVPERIGSVTQQWEAKLGYTGQHLQLSGGYSGSRYHNSYEQMNVLTAAGAGSGSQPIALAPDNASHQFFATGGYNFTDETRGTFKVSFTRATQDEGFIDGGARLAASAGRTSLDGEIDTTLVNLGVTSHPIDRLSLLASVRYENRDDNTERSQFLTATGTRDGFNVITSRQSLLAKAEGSYRLPENYRVTAGVDFEQRERDFPPRRQASWREKSDEVTARVELRKSLSDTFNGAVGYQHGERDGSSYLEAGAAADADVIAPVHWVDRSRDKLKLSAEWAPMEKLSVQFATEHSLDDYNQRDVGPNKGTASVYTVDATYALSDDWQLSGWYTRDETEVKGGSCAVAGTGAFCGSTAAGTAWRKWFSTLEMTGDSVGFGVKGKLMSKLTFGADVEAMIAESSYSLVNGATGGPGTVPAAAVDLPSHEYKQTTLKLYADYAYRPDLSVRASAVHQRSTTDDWLWTDGNGNPYTFSNGGSTNTTVVQPGVEDVTFVGLSLTYKWW